MEFVQCKGQGTTCNRVMSSKNDERSGEFRVIFIIFKQTIYVMQNLIDYSLRTNNNTTCFCIHSMKIIYKLVCIECNTCEYLSQYLYIEWNYQQCLLLVAFSTIFYDFDVLFSEWQSYFIVIVMMMKIRVPLVTKTFYC